MIIRHQSASTREQHWTCIVSEAGQGEEGRKSGKINQANAVAQQSPMCDPRVTWGGSSVGAVGGINCGKINQANAVAQQSPTGDPAVAHG